MGIYRCVLGTELGTTENMQIQSAVKARVELEAFNSSALTAQSSCLADYAEVFFFRDLGEYTLTVPSGLVCIDSPGHGTFWLQAWVSEGCPSHFLPPYCAAGESHSRFLDCVPCLQVLVQVLQLLHSPQFPLTEKNTYKYQRSHSILQSQGEI